MPKKSFNSNPDLEKIQSLLSKIYEKIEKADRNVKRILKFHSKQLDISRKFFSRLESKRTIN